jgi:hypothetical protein
MKCVDDFRLRLGKHELVPIVIGGMGVDISTSDLALEAARLGGVGHISDAMVPTVSDRRYNTKYVKDKLRQYKYNVANSNKADVQFDLALLAEATEAHVRHTMERKRGEGLIFINCMEKLTMNAPKETLRVRLRSALDAGIDGITLAAGLHLGGNESYPDVFKPFGGFADGIAVEDGYVRLRTTLPAILTVVKEINEPRLPSLKGKMRAKSAQITVWTAKDLNIDTERTGLNGSPTQVMRIFTPPKPLGGKILQGEVKDSVAQLLVELKAAGMAIGGGQK